MGIPGLINALGPGERISLSKLAISHLERTSRPIRIAVDISIWLFQVQAGRGGKNPELRTLFFRLLKILALPIHPLFVYDGKNKPPFKRGKAVSSRSYGNAPIIQLSKILIDLFRFPRHEAPGEAEAECSRLQMAGVVDAVMSNDVDALMFGSGFTVMNFSKEAGSSAGGATHVTCYKMGMGDTSNVPLDRPGMILFAMLSGGDYLPTGSVAKCGSKTAAEIAKAGFGNDLLEILEADGAELETRLNEWRDRLQYELEENESGYFQTKHKVVRIPETFPDRTILSYYAKPVVSSEQQIESLKDRLRNAWDQEVNAKELRDFTAHAFEWNYRSGARKVIRLLAEPLVSYRLRLGQHPTSGRPRLSNNDVQTLQKVYKSRTSFITDGQIELQYEMVPIDVVGLDLLAEQPNPPLQSQGTTASGDEEEDGDGEEITPQSPIKKRTTKSYDPFASEKVWIFESVASIGVPETVENWKKEQAAKLSAPKKTITKKSGPRRRKELDPSMKQGSILKYGTLKKGRSDMSEYKSAQLFEAAVSTSSPTKTPPFSSPVTGAGPGMYGLTMSTSPKLNQRVDGFDYLVDRFASCDLSGSGSPVKRRPVTRSLHSQRVAVTSGGVEIIEIPDTDDEYSPPATPKLRMSFSNASYRELRCHNYFSRPCSPSPRQAKQVEDQVAPEIAHLEHAVSSLNLTTHDGDNETKSSQKSRTKSKEPETSVEDIALDRSKVTLEDPVEKTKPKHRKAPAVRKKASGSEETQPGRSRHGTINTTSASREAPTHIESITAYDGFWTVSAPATERDHEAHPTDTEGPKNDKKKKKRFARVSILDLT
ncbi:crossover junction endodeoxyribonuclease [Aspergillus mulundensis]|uniref:XPG-I domain-containing protein n=1 Tax=Aspergillus mulundensis TaxID=1810919 RepID=A0A3D8SKL7_9EURO|nr:hypothetical protein DSM5745_03512 [Aspergillus mulundensis]RDW86870.1 hypothetical protein DSM5745_03512 [Aspergillus mulundensis]